MDDRRKEELRETLFQKASEILSIVGDDLPEGGYISLNVWRGSTLAEIRPHWESDLETVSFFQANE